MANEEPLPDGGDFGLHSLLEHWRRWRSRHLTPQSLSIRVSDRVSVAGTAQVIVAAGVASEAVIGRPSVLLDSDQELLIQAAITVFGDSTAEGQLVTGVGIAWLEILSELERDPEFLLRLSPRQLEEFVAGAYEREGWPEVVLTPASGDLGRDIIATKPGVGSIRIIDQVKRFDRHRRVTAHDVRALVGVLTRDQNVSKGIVTTTADFAPGVMNEFKMFMPYRLELKNGVRLREWLLAMADRGIA